MSDYATSQQIDQLVNSYRSAKKRLIACDYDGVLSELKDDPSAEASQPTAETLQLLNGLTSQPDTVLAIITGRKKEDVDSWFSNSPNIYLSAEHGGWRRHSGAWEQRVKPDPRQLESVISALRPFTDRVPGSHIETKFFGVVWHYRTADPQAVMAAVPDVEKVLHEITRGTELDTFVSTSGGQIIEVKPKNMHKGSVMQELIVSISPDFIMVMGDDYTDEHMFEACPSSAYTIRVGGGETTAKLSIPGVPDVFAILQRLSES